MNDGAPQHPPTPPCPPWCELPAGHPWHRHADGTWSRRHSWRRTLGAQSIGVEETEHTQSSTVTRARRIAIDTDEHIRWDFSTALSALVLLSHALALACDAGDPNRAADSGFGV